MSNIDIVWDNQNQRGDWQVTPEGRLSTGNLLVTAVYISWFTDRVAQPDYVPPDGSGDRRGWWQDTFDGTQIGSRLWQLRRKKIANRPALIAEATDILNESTQWMIDTGIVSAINLTVTSAPAGPGNPGTLLQFAAQLVEPTGTAPLVSALWSAV